MLLKKMLLLLIQFVYRSAVSQTPCSFYFSYRAGNLGSTIGAITVPTDNISLPITLKVQLAIRVALRTKYVGLLILSEHPTLVLGKLLTSRPNKINYTVRFPLPHPLPIIQKIEVNKRTLCIGENITFLDYGFGGVTTKILLEHTFPASQIPRTLNRILDDSPSKYETAKTKGEDEDCGRSYFLGTPMIGNTTPKNWPWLAAIFLNDNSEVTFQCAGTLITNRHLVTAAHCMKNHENKKWNSTNFIIAFGIQTIANIKDLHSQVTQVDKIIIHPEYNESSYVADIAVLEFIKVTFNEQVSPVCIWNEETSLKPLTGHFGTVVGWGLDQVTRKMKKEPEVYQLPIVDQTECLRSRKEFMYITSERTFCAGLRNGTGPCSGDSGSGLLIPTYHKNSIIWFLRGLISLTLLDQNQDTCDLNEYIVFTDVARFTNWLKNVTNALKL